MLRSLCCQICHAKTNPLTFSPSVLTFPVCLRIVMQYLLQICPGVHVRFAHAELIVFLASFVHCRCTEHETSTSLQSSQCHHLSPSNLTSAYPLYRRMNRCRVMTRNARARRRACTGRRLCDSMSASTRPLQLCFFVPVEAIHFSVCRRKAASRSAFTN